MILHPRLRAREARNVFRQARTLALAERLDSRPLEYLKARQFRLLRWILNYAYDNIPLYRSNFDRAGVRPGDMRSLDDLEKVPILTKEQILSSYPEGIVAPGYGPATSFRCSSSGTSGVKGEYLSDRKTRDETWALLFRVRAKFGYRPWHKEGVFSFIPHKRKWFENLGYMRKFDISMGKPLPEVVEDVERINPDIIWGVPTYIHYLISEQEDIRASPKFVLCSGEYLAPVERMDIEDRFGCPVVNFYGCAEAPFISTECQLHEGQHVNMLNALVEVSRDGVQLGPGEVGDVLVTTLTNTAMPLIRYNTGDAATMSPDECSCGRHGDMLATLEGRRDDFLMTPAGRIPPMMALVAVAQPEVKGYRIVQEAMNRLVVDLKGDTIDDGTRATIAGRLGEVLKNPDLEVEFRMVSDIRPEPSGKRRVVICNA